MLNLGCGPAREIQEFLAEEPLCDQAQFSLLDFNEETIQHTSRVLEELKRRYGRRTPIQIQKKSVQHVLKEGAKPLVDAPDRSYDFIYCAGLLDYLPDRTCAQLMNVLYDWLAPGGLLAATNVEDCKPFRHMLEFVLDWHLIYRGVKKSAALAAPASCGRAHAHLQGPDGSERLHRGEETRAWLTEHPTAAEIQAAFAEYDRQETISNFKVACIIGMTLMPAGVILDYAVYPAFGASIPQIAVPEFAFSLAPFLTLLLTPLGRKHYRFLGVTLFMLPASFIAWMIYARPEGAASPYYAGLNLVLLVLAFVLHWTFRESLVAAVLVLGLYLAAACFVPGIAHARKHRAVHQQHLLSGADRDHHGDRQLLPQQGTLPRIRVAV